MQKNISRRASLARLAGGAVALSSYGSGWAQAAMSQGSEVADPLHLDINRFQPQDAQAGGKTLAVRAYEGVVYVRKPVDAQYQRMNIYVPEAYFHGEAVGGWNAATAPIFLPNQVGGYMPGAPGTAAPAKFGPQAGQESTIAAALVQGFVVASPGARGRTLKDAQGRFTGKAPAAIVDLKAAVRFLRLNAGVLPGNTGRIISNGTSAGGALSALLGASGNSPDYLPYLDEIGAASERDDVFAVSAYCPITNLEHADAAYEWLFQGVNDFRKIDMRMLDFHVERKEVSGTLTPAQIRVSRELHAAFPAYLNSLKLRSPEGVVLQLDDDGRGSFAQLVKRYVMASAQTALDAGKDMSRYPWLTLEGRTVKDMDFDAYVRYAGRMKLPPAFDALDLSSGENNLFGTATVDSQHFTVYSTQHSTASDGGPADAKLVKMMNAMRYIGTDQVQTAHNWRIRHGTIDRDTASVIPIILATALQNKGYAVDFAMPWDVPHRGDYDLPELFAWMQRVARGA